MRVIRGETREGRPPPLNFTGVCDGALDDSSVTLTDVQPSSCQIMENLVCHVTSWKQEMLRVEKEPSHVSHVTKREGRHDEVKTTSFRHH